MDPRVKPAGDGAKGWINFIGILLVMIVFVTVVVMNMPTMIVPVMVEMSVPVFMRVFMPLGMVMQPLAGPRPARVLAEHERLDGDRHRVRRHADAAEVDIVEVH